MDHHQREVLVQLTAALDELREEIRAVRRDLDALGRDVVGAATSISLAIQDHGELR